MLGVLHDIGHEAAFRNDICTIERFAVGFVTYCLLITTT